MEYPISANSFVPLDGRIRWFVIDNRDVAVAGFFNRGYAEFHADVFGWCVVKGIRYSNEKIKIVD